MHWLQDSLELTAWVHAVGAVVLFHAWSYPWHRINHEVLFFWRFHRVHHTDPNMDVPTANRFHLGEIFFSSLFRLAIIGLPGIYLMSSILRVDWKSPALIRYR